MSRTLTPMSPAEAAEAFDQAIADGAIVYCRCWCLGWWLAAKDVGSTCGACGEPMVAVSNPKRQKGEEGAYGLRPEQGHGR